MVVGVAWKKQTFPDTKIILNPPTLKGERIFYLKQHETSADQACVCLLQGRSLEKSSLSKYTQAQMIFKGLICLFVPAMLFHSSTQHDTL